ncbi:ATP-binding protein [Streptomyces sp. NBC_00439]|uniref:ATP-binding protein n=1 Tax=Streptomyces sp. NBC_00439 TaxID=2903650 RepID=UPI00224EA97F|nr:ATP-binding protein [Streptomyces sp. NBC_00439]MCX5103011.1 tetratricopeptide repeat protein [Streptomyces sp. NBC_00439]MCX5106698.1 tetratricopeptide repeat protein [Streptomyces sp. NBC_00439]
MAGKPTRQELNRQRRRSGFIGRRDELHAFRENLTRDPAEEAFQYLFHVHGQAGVGKSSLVRQWEAVARESQAVTAYLDDDVHGVIEAMEAISAQLARQQSPLKRFDKQLASYRQRRHEVETSAAVTAPVGAEGATNTGQSASASMSSTVLAQAGLAGLGMVPGLGPVAGALDPQQLAQSTDRLRAALSTRLRSHDDVQLVMSPLRVLTPVFLQDLAEVAERRAWVVLLFDVYEQTGPVLGEWLRDVLTGDEYGELPSNVVAVLSGQGQLDAGCWGDQLDLVTEVPLDVFTEDEARRLLATRGITREDVIDVILQLTGRLPVLVDFLAQTRPQDAGEVSDPSETAVERFLKWESAPHRREAAMVCALPLQLDEDLFRAVVPDVAAGDYAWLRTQSFITGQAGRCRYHDVVRSPMLRLQRTQSPSRWRQRHTLLADTYQQRRQTLQETLDVESYWADATWREHQLNEMYHRLCADPNQALPDALHQAVHACRRGVAVLRRWTQLLAQAGHDTDTTALTAWADSLVPPAADADNALALVTVLTRLLSAANLTAPDRALAYCFRGREHRVAQRYGQALADYTAALALDPLLSDAHFGSGATQFRKGNYEGALAAFTHAIELSPEDSWALVNRAMTHRAMGNHNDALADHDRALELDPENSEYLTHRAVTHRAMGHYDRSLSDLNTAIALDNTSPWSLANRGECHRSMGNNSDALADFNRALELDSTYVWALISRGMAYQDLGNNDDALADLNRAVELSPEDSWALVNRAMTHRAMGNHNDALADHDRALELDPDDFWALTSRSLTHRHMGNQNSALADLNRAIELNSTFGWAFASRGVTQQEIGNYDNALSDLNRAIELAPENSWYLTDRSITHRSLGNYDDALTDLNRAIELNSTNASAHTNRGITHHSLGNYDDALTDLNRAIELDSTSTWDLIRRGIVHRSLGNYDDALTDLNRAIELDSTNTHTLFHRGDLYRVMGSYCNALQDFNRAIELDPESFWAFTGRGSTHRLSCRYDDALTDLNRAIELDPETIWSHFEAAVVHRCLNSPGEHEHWRKTVELLTAETSAGKTDEVHARGNLLVIYCAIPEWDLAMEELERFLSCEPHPSRIRAALLDLTEFLQPLDLDPAQLQPLRQRLQNAAGVV